MMRTTSARNQLLPVLLPFALSVALLALLGGGCDREVVLPAGLAWDPSPAPTYVNQARLALTNNGDDTLAFVSLDSIDSPRLLGLGLVGFNPIEREGPHHLTASPDGQFIYFNLSNYVVNGGSGPHGAHGTGTVPGYAVKFDVRSGRQIGQALVDRSPGDIIISPDGRYVYVSHYDLARLQAALLRGAPETEGWSSLFIVDTAVMAVVSQLPVCPTGHGMGLSADARELYLVCTQSDELAVLNVADPAHPSITTKLKVGPAPGATGNPAYAPYALAVAADGTVWVSDNASGDVRAYDPKSRTMDKSRVITVGGVAMFADFTPDGKWLVVPHQGDDRVTAVNLSTLASVVLPLPQSKCLNVHALRVFAGPPPFAAMVCEGDHVQRKGSVVFSDLPPDFVGWSVHGSVELGLFPDGLAPLPALP